MSIKYLAAVLIISLSGFTLKAQGIEFGLFLGASNYMGDLSNNSMDISQTHPSLGVIGRYNLSEKWAVKGYVGYGRISGDDKNSSLAADKTRNLSFYSDIYEVSAQLEYNLIRNSIRYTSSRKLIPYLFAGVGVFNFNPKTELAGRTYELQPLGTEGQGTTQYNDKEKYALTQICIPFGIGFKKKISERICIGIELGARYTFTNYLDDIGGTYGDPRVIGRSSGAVSQALSDRSWELRSDGIPVFKEGDKRSHKSLAINDIYFMGGLTFTYVFPNAGMRCPKF